MGKEIGRRHNANIDFILEHYTDEDTRSKVEDHLTNDLSPRRVAKLRKQLEKESGNSIH
jgi:hypothetical protein